MRPSDNVNELIKKLKLKASVNLDKRVHDDISMALAESEKTKSAVTQPNIWRIIMKNPLTKVAIASVLTIACLTGLFFWKSTGSGIALADVLTRIEQVTAYMYQMRSTVTKQQTRTDLISTVLISQENGLKITTKRIDSNNNEINSGDTYILPKLNSVIFVVHEEKMYVRAKFDGTLAFYKEEYNDPRIMIKQILNCDHTSLGQSVIDGVAVEGFRTVDSAYGGGFWGHADFVGRPEKVDVRLWVDVNTFLPVRLEEDIVMKKGTRRHEVSYDFRWNVVVSADDFKPVKPEGYISSGEIAVPAVKEENAIKGLRLFVSLAGEYPDNLDTEILNKEARGLIGLVRDSLEEIADDEKKMKKLTGELISMMGPAFFYEKLVYDNKDPAYYGKTVTPKDANKVLLRWKLSDNEYRVIYGDLRAETVSPEKLAELENLVLQPRVKASPTAEQESSPAVKAGNIIWVSDAFDESGDGKPDDQAWVDMLKARGYTLDYTKVASPSRGYWRTLNNDKLAALNAADLIIVSRCTGSRFYVNDDEPKKWNSVKTPMILFCAYFTRKQCWSWLDTRSPAAVLWPGRPPSHSDVSTLMALVPQHPIFKDVQLDSKHQVKIFDQTAGSGKVSFNPIADVGNGTLIAKPANQDWTFIAEWEPGLEFYPGAGQTPAGRRIMFAAGTIQWVGGGCGRGEYNLNTQGEKLFINIIEYMLGNLEQEPNAKKQPTGEQN